MVGSENFLASCRLVTVGGREKNKKQKSPTLWSKGGPTHNSSHVVPNCWSLAPSYMVTLLYTMGEDSYNASRFIYYIPTSTIYRNLGSIK